MILVNKFYCGAHGVEDSMTRYTLQEAIELAAQKLADDPKRQSVAIVQIVKIVKRRTDPVVVLDVE